MEYESTQIANFFIEQSFAEHMPISPLKVLKLTYIAHGWHLGITGNPLVKEPVQAWKYGPVLEDLYHKLKHYRNTPITELIQEKKGIRQVPPTNTEVIAFLRKIWSLYKRYSGLQLSRMTHAPNTPWYSTVEQYRHKRYFPMFLTIDNEDIKRHYKAKYEALPS